MIEQVYPHAEVKPLEPDKVHRYFPYHFLVKKLVLDLIYEFLLLLQVEAGHHFGAPLMNRFLNILALRVQPSFLCLDHPLQLDD